MQETDFVVNACKGIENQVADLLSRLEHEALLDLGDKG